MEHFGFMLNIHFQERGKKLYEAQTWALISFIFSLIPSFFRTINSEFDQTNFSVIPSLGTVSLSIQCAELVSHRSRLDNGSFHHRRPQCGRGCANALLQQLLLLIHRCGMRKVLLPNAKMEVWSKIQELAKTTPWLADVRPSHLIPFALLDL